MLLFLPAAFRFVDLNSETIPQVVHCYLDYLWRMGPQTLPNEGFRLDGVRRSAPATLASMPRGFVFIVACFFLFFPRRCRSAHAASECLYPIFGQKGVV